MSSIHSVTTPIAESAGTFFKNFGTKVGNLCGRVVVFFKNLPSHMQTNPLAGISVFVVANSIFYLGVHFFTNFLLKRVNNHPDKSENPQEKKDQRVVKNILFKILIPGLAVFGFNIALSKITQFPLSRIALAAITATAIALRFLFSPKEPPKKSMTDQEKLEKTNQEIANQQEMTHSSHQELTPLEKKESQYKASVLHLQSELDNDSSDSKENKLNELKTAQEKHKETSEILKAKQEQLASNQKKLKELQQQQVDLKKKLDLPVTTP